MLCCGDYIGEAAAPSIFCPEANHCQGSQSAHSENPSSLTECPPAGRTGKLVFSSLTDSPSFEAVGLVRTEASAKRLMKYTECGIDHVVVSDITQLGSDEDSSTPQGLAGAEAMIICTSSVPYISKGSALKAIMRIPLNIAMGRKALNPRDLRFRFRPGQYPEKVDYEGQVKQIDLAKRLGIGHVIVVRCVHSQPISTTSI